MEVQRKTIQKLTESLDEKRSELTDLYHRFGEKLLQEAEESADGLISVSTEKIESWRSLMASREGDTQAILEIKDVLARKQELVQFNHEIKRNLSDVDVDYHSVLEKIGNACYERYADSELSPFGKVGEKASVEGAILVKLETKREKLVDELKSAGALSRMLVQLKITTNNAAIKQRRSRMMSILTEGARNLVENGTLEQSMEAGELDEQLEQIMNLLRDTTNKREDLDSRREMLETEKQSLQDTLNNYNATDNPQHRIEEIHLKIKDTDRRITTLSIMVAKEYSDTYIDDKGARLEEKFPTTLDRSQALEQVEALRVEIGEIRKNIKILEASLKIAALEKNLASIERSRVDYEKKIKQYGDQINSLEKKRQEALVERTSLEEYRDSIQKTII